MTTPQKMMFTYAAKQFRDYLVIKMPGVRFSGDVPASVPPKLVTITQVPAGPSEESRTLGWRRLIFRCYGTDEMSSATLSEEVRANLVDAARYMDGIHRINVVGEPGRYDDPKVATPSFQLTVDALLRSTPTTE